MDMAPAWLTAWKGREPHLGVINREAARALGLTRYFTGEPCKHGHVAERWRNNGKYPECKRACHAANPEKLREAQRAWAAAKPEKARGAWGARARKANPEKRREWIRNRDANMLNATPAWADRDAVLAACTEAERLTQATGVLHHVDHIGRLQSKLVCGLHVACNLQPLPASGNISKGNRHWPGMFESGVN